MLAKKGFQNDFFLLGTVPIITPFRILEVRVSMDQIRNCSITQTRSNTVNVAINVPMSNKKKSFFEAFLSLLFETIFRCFVLKISIKKQIMIQRWFRMNNIARKKGHEG